MDAIACNICKEPAWNFLCMDCVSRDVKKFLPKKLVGEFSSFHRTIYSHFDSNQLALNGTVHCFNCRSTKESPVCQNCYTQEVRIWLKERNPNLTTKFLKMFSFGGLPEMTAEERPPVEEEFGICDECGEYTEELVLAEGEWVCKECAIYQGE